MVVIASFFLFSFIVNIEFERLKEVVSFAKEND